MKQLFPVSRRYLYIMLLLFTVSICRQNATAEDAQAGKNIWQYGTFDNEQDVNPPKGWFMWGADRYKIPANYTIDTNNPHSGKGCIRIHQPAKTTGYINTDPDLAVKAKKGMMYTISFWARTDMPGASTCFIEGYKSVNPVAGPDTGHTTVARIAIDLDKEWKKFSLTIHEGWEVFVGKNEYLMVGLRAIVSKKDRGKAKTIWIDDYQIFEAPSDRDGQLLNTANVKYDKLNHRLTPGSELAFTVDARKKLRAMPEPVSGVSFHRVAGWMGLPYDRDGNYVLPKEQEKAILEMRLPMTRFYAVGDEKFSLEESIDKAAAMCDKADIPQETVVLEFETQGASTKLSPEVWVRGVKYSLSKGYGFQHWEISNEPYLNGAVAFPTKKHYLDHFLAVSKAIRKVHPEGKIGLAAWGDDLYQLAAGHYDFVVNHHYVFNPKVQTSPIEDIALGANYKKLQDIMMLNAQLEVINPGRGVYQYDTEWGMHCSGPKGTGRVKRNANIYGTLHRAVRLLYYAREGMVKGASSWEMFSPEPNRGYTFSYIPKNTPGKYYMFYWLYYYFNRHKGANALDTVGTAPWYEATSECLAGQKINGPLTPVLVSTNKAGTEMYFYAVNGSWDKSVPCEMKIENFDAASTKGVYLSSDDPDVFPLVERKEDFIKPFKADITGNTMRCTLPPHSAVFLTIGK